MDLAAYLLDVRTWRWAPGSCDCTTFVAEWVETWGLGDAMAEWRGAYASDEQAERLVADAGGLAALYDEGLARIGAVPVTCSEPGDVGVIRAQGVGSDPVDVGAIWAGRRWAFFTPGGLAFASAAPVAAWGRPWLAL